MGTELYPLTRTFHSYLVALLFVWSTIFSINASLLRIHTGKKQHKNHSSKTLNNIVPTNTNETLNNQPKSTKGLKIQIVGSFELSDRNQTRKTRFSLFLSLGCSNFPSHSFSSYVGTKPKQRNESAM